jgi:tRNA-2-methylthio-N6-dimethylallyladenosine synthase
MREVEQYGSGEDQRPGSTAAGVRYHIETWGCQMNVHDSEKLAGSMESLGYSKAAGRHDADVILFNSCSIREKASEKVFSEVGRLRHLKRKNPRLIIGLCGCVAQQEGEAIFARAPIIDFVIGPRATASLPRTLERLRAGDMSVRHTVDIEYRDDSIRYPFDAIRRESPETGKAYVTIIEGCNHRCTYCIVPTTRGREIYRPMNEVLTEVRALAETGILEVEFLGQTVNAYRDLDANTLADLLRAAAAVPGIERLRFTTSHPAQMTESLMDAMHSTRPTLCPYLHLPVQSGSSDVLARMRRGYDRDTYVAKIQALRDRMPEMLFGTDVIVGFPGETEEEFAKTLDLLDEVSFDTVYSFAYSERPGTRAIALGDDVPMAVKMERLQRLQARQQEIQRRRNQRWIGEQVEVLVEGRSKRDASRWTGRTPENRIVHFAGQTSPGRLEWVKITASTPYSLMGTPCGPPGTSLDLA